MFQRQAKAVSEVPQFFWDGVVGQGRRSANGNKLLGSWDWGLRVGWWFHAYGFMMDLGILKIEFLCELFSFLPRKLFCPSARSAIHYRFPLYYVSTNHAVAITHIRSDYSGL